MTHDYKRHGTTTLFAALNVLDGTVIGRCMQRHRHQEFLRFLNAVEAAVPAGKLVHAILDNYATHKHPKVLAWLARHPRWTFHFTPTSCSWLNAVETFFAKLTRRRLKRGIFPSLVALQEAINRFVEEHNGDPRPFVWTTDPDAIVEKVRRGFHALASWAAGGLACALAEVGKHGDRRRAERRLAAILAADVVGYSRLVEQDEAGTLAALRALRREVLDPLLAEHHGRLVKLMGDGVIAEFGSRGRRRGLRRRDAAGAWPSGRPGRRPSGGSCSRIGVNLGDVVVEGTAISSATGSTSPPGWSSSASRAACWSRARPTTISRASSAGRSSPWASSSSRTSRGRCASIGCASSARTEPARRP